MKIVLPILYVQLCILPFSLNILQLCLLTYMLYVLNQWLHDITSNMHLFYALIQHLGYIHFLLKQHFRGYLSTYNFSVYFNLLLQNTCKELGLKIKKH